jgi:hypothetical protein
MSTYAYNEILNQVERLTPDEQRQLMKDIEAMLQRQAESKPRHSVKEFRGIAKDHWKGVNVQEYIDQERDSWGG